MEKVIKTTKWYKPCHNPTEESRTNLLNSLPPSELERLLQEYPDLSSSNICSILEKDYKDKTTRNSQCHNDLTMMRMEDTEFIADLYFLKVDNIVFCLEEPDVKYSIEHGKNPHTTKPATDEEINKMKEWLASKRLHSFDYETGDEFSDYQQARDRFINFMDYPINTYFASDKFFNQLTTTQLKEIPRSLESRTGFLTFTSEEKDKLDTFLIKDDLLVYLTGLLTEKFESTGDNVQTSKLVLKELVDGMNSISELIKNKFIEALKKKDWDTARDILLNSDLSNDEVAELKDRYSVTFGGVIYFTSADGKELKIYNNASRSIPSFDKLVNLEELYILKTNVKHLAPNAFDRLVNLKLLNISSNKVLTSLPTGIFDKLANLKKLELYKNNLEHLPKGIFDKLVNLEFLDLSDNILDVISPVFDKLVNLKILYILNNKLTSLPKGIFDNLVNLESLVLKNNSLYSISKELFVSLRKLETFNISDNKLLSLPEGIFDNFVNVWWISLSNNLLISLPDEIFDNLGNLKTLIINDNQLTTLPTSITKTSLKSLKYDRSVKFSQTQQEFISSIDNIEIMNDKFFINSIKKEFAEAAESGNWILAGKILKRPELSQDNVKELDDIMQKIAKKQMFDSMAQY